MRRIIGGLLTLIVLVGPDVNAQDPPPKTKSFAADFGFVSVSGNTSVTTLNFGDKLVLNTPDKRVIFTQTFNAVRSETDGEKNAENLRAQVRLDYGFTGKLYGFGLAGWDRNVFGGVARRFEETIGLAYKAIATETDELGLEAGFSLFQQRNVIALPGESLDDKYKAARAAAQYRHTFNKASFITQLVELIPNLDDSDDLRINSETAFVAPISTRVSFKFGYIVRYDNLPGLQPPPNPTGARLEKTDRFLTAGITISY